MIKITKTTHYWLFEQLNPIDNPYWYIRTATDGLMGYNWLVGRENMSGGVSSVDGDLPDKKILELENRFQDMAKMVNM